jgi:hypothetical protein
MKYCATVNNMGLETTPLLYHINNMSLRLFKTANLTFSQVSQTSITCHVVRLQPLTPVKFHSPSFYHNFVPTHQHVPRKRNTDLRHPSRMRLGPRRRRYYHLPLSSPHENQNTRSRTERGQGRGRARSTAKRCEDSTAGSAGRHGHGVRGAGG